jgi:hypothetical protein
MEGQVGQIGSLLHAQVLEGLGFWVDHLVDELTLDLVGRQGVPPQVLVDVVSEGLEEGLGDVDVAALLDDFAVDQLGNLGSGVVLGAVQLVCLTRGAVVMQHALEGGTDIDGLDRVSSVNSFISKATYVNRPVALLHVVGSEHIANLSQLVKKVVLETEHRRGTHDCCLGVDLADDLLTPCLYIISTPLVYIPLEYTDLGGKVLRGRVTAGVVGRNVNETVDIVLGDSIGDALDTVNVDILVGEIPGTVNECLYRHYTQQLTWWDIDDRQGCRQHRSDERSPRWIGCCAGRIPIPLLDIQIPNLRFCKTHTMNTTRPRSPVTFKCLLAISSR